MSAAISSLPSRVQDVVVTPVRAKADLERFIRLPWQLYRKDPHWVPPILDQQRELLDPARHPYHQHAEVELLLARRDGKDVGRIAATVNHSHNRFHGDSVGFFSFYESIDDQEVAEALMSAASDWLRKRGMTSVRGPLNFTLNEECGILIDGFETPPVLLNPHNPRYYPVLMDRIGMRKAKDLYAYTVDFREDHRDAARIEKERRVIAHVKKRHDITVRKVDVRHPHEEVRLIKEVYNDAWSHLWGFVPLTDAEVDQLADELLPMLVPEFTRLALVGGKPAAFVLAVPNYNEAFKRINGRLWPFGVPTILAYRYLRLIKGIRLVAVGCANWYRKDNVATILLHDVHEAGLRSQYQWCEASLILEDNYLMNNKITRIWNGKRYKLHRVYERDL